MTVSNLVILAVRYGLVVLFFPASALNKIFNFNGAGPWLFPAFQKSPGSQNRLNRTAVTAQ